MLAQTNLPEVHDRFRMLKRDVPVLGRGHEDGDGPLRLDVHVIVLSGRVRTVCARGMIILRVEAYRLIVGRQPVENFLLTERGSRKQARSQDREKNRSFVVSHNTFIGARRPLSGKIPGAGTSRLSILSRWPVDIGLIGGGSVGERPAEKG